MHEVRTKQKERNEKLLKAGTKTVEVIKLNHLIKSKLPETEKLLGKMRSALTT